MYLACFFLKSKVEYYFSMTASSVSVEKMLSQSGNKITDGGNRLNADIVNALMVIRNSLSN